MPPPKRPTDGPADGSAPECVAAAVCNEYAAGPARAMTTASAATARFRSTSNTNAAAASPSTSSTSDSSRRYVSIAVSATAPDRIATPVKPLRHNATAPIPITPANAGANATV